MVPDEDGNTGSSTSPCSDTFSGPSALSEPECATVDNFLNENPGIFDTYIAVRTLCKNFKRFYLNFQLHSYQHSFLYPYGNSRSSAVSKIKE